MTLNDIFSSQASNPSPVAPLLANHLLTGEELSQGELSHLIDVAAFLKKNRGTPETSNLLQGKTLALVFEKPSLRTRMSFTVAMRELGGDVVESVSAHSKSEEPEDVARVVSGYCHGLMVRTFDQSVLDRMAKYARVPVINGLSNSHHPCQVFADLLTLKECFGTLSGVRVAYVGDGNNMLHSLMILLPFLGGHLTYACPQGFEPNPEILARAQERAIAGGGSITSHASPQSAVQGVNAIYTDVWTSMGFEDADPTQDASKNAAFEGYQVNESLLALAAENAVIMHCLPMVRGQEISETLPEHPASVLFQQSENRLHVQKALLTRLMGPNRKAS